MGIRIQPREIDVPADAPFKNDLLGRQEPVEVLTHLVGSLEGPCVLAVDAAWGNGKTTFLNMWEKYLLKQKFPVVKFNAWETDFSGDPFVALSKELTHGLKDFTTTSRRQEIEKGAKKVLQETLPILMRLGAASIPGVGPEVSKFVESYVSSYVGGKDSVRDFRDTLEETAKVVSESTGGKPVVVMIDELDRCRPSYAVELLEVAKHLFAVDHMVFVLAVNRTQLAHSVKGLYGEKFDAQGYLRRFFDVDFRLPEPDRKVFIDQLLASMKIDDYITQGIDRQAQSDYENVKKWLHCFFHDLSLRSIAQAIHRLGLVFASLRKGESFFVKMAAVALILRTIDSDLYHKFVRGDITDAEVVDKIFDRPGFSTLKHQLEGHLFEAAVLVTAQDGGWNTEESNRSELLDKYLKCIGLETFYKLGTVSHEDWSEMFQPQANCSELYHARKVLYFARWEYPVLAKHGPQEFKEAVRRLELFSPNLIDDR